MGDSSFKEKKSVNIIAIIVAVIVGVIVIGIMIYGAMELRRYFGSTKNDLIHNENIIFGDEEHIKALWDNRTLYAGDNSAIINLVTLLDVGEEKSYDHIELHTVKEPYMVEVFHKVDHANIEEAKKAAEEKARLDALILLALIDNAEAIKLTYFYEDKNGTQMQSATYDDDWAEEVVGREIEWYAESTETLNQLVHGNWNYVAEDNFEATESLD